MVLWMGHKTEMKLEQWGTPTIKQGVLNMRKNSLVYPLILHSISYSTVGCSTKKKSALQFLITLVDGYIAASYSDKD